MSGFAFAFISRAPLPSGVLSFGPASLMLAKNPSPDLSPGGGFFICTAPPPADRPAHQQARNSPAQIPPPADRQKPPPEQRARATEQAGTATSQTHRQTDRPATRPGQKQRYDKQQQT